jgi:hypothetical protein
MRRLITRGRLRVCSVAVAGLAIAGLIVLTALQPVSQGGRPRVDAFQVRHDLAVASAAVAASSAAATSTPPASPTAATTLRAVAVIPSPLPVLIVRIAPQAPTPTPAPAPPRLAAAAAAPAPALPGYTRDEVIAILTAAAQSAGIAPSWLISTATCESNLNPYSQNPSGPYDGLLQFLPSTFRAHGGTDIWDPTQQAQIAATMFASGESGEWPVCSR